MKEFAGRILILVENLPVPFDRRVWLEALALTEAAYKVSVISPRWKNDKKYEILQNVGIYRYNVPAQTKGYLSYIWEFLYCWFMTFALSIKVSFCEKFDVIQACNPPDTFFLIGAIYKIFGKRFVFDQHDLSPETYLVRFKKKGGLIYRLLLLLEKLTYKTADVVISTNHSIQDIALKRGRVREEDSFIVRTGPDLNRLKVVGPAPELRRNKKYLVCYLGVMGPQDGVDYLLKSIRWIVREQNRKDIQFALIGEGDYTDNLKATCEEFDLNSFVHFTGRIPDNELVTYLSTADICVSPDPKNGLNEYHTMNKTLEYMAMGKPIVAFDLKETRVSAGDAAVYVNPNDYVEFGRSILDLIGDRKKREVMGKIGRKRVEEELGWEHTKKNLIEAYKRVFSK